MNNPKDKSKTDPAGTRHGCDWETARAEEFKAIRECGGDPKALYGLALSGGGIRSASFGLGVLHALERAKIVERLDYMSTVSGGGYCGTALTWALCQQTKKNQPASRRYFPLGFRPSADKGPDEDHVKISNQRLDFIRQNACYLSPGHGLGLAALAASALRGLLVTLFVYGAWILILMKGVLDLETSAHAPGASEPGWFVGSWPLSAAVFMCGVFGLLTLGYALARRGPGSVPHAGYVCNVKGQVLIGRVWALILILAVIGSIPPLARGVMAVGLAGALTAIGGLGGVLQLLGLKGSASGLRLRLQGAGLLLAAVFLIYGLLLGAYILNAHWSAMLSPTWSNGRIWIGYGLLGLVSILVAGFANPNYVGHHRMYRDRLMELFMPDEEALQGRSWALARDADDFMLQDVPIRRPYHLINTNLILVDDPIRRYRDRGGDSFVLAPLWSGGTATGWSRTEALSEDRGRGMTLATAMAISGAAMNPRTGPGGRGFMRSWPVSTLMSLLDLRLGYWLSTDRALPMQPNLMVPGLKGLIGYGFKANSKYLELSDGGHFDNTGVYELLRRRVSRIILADAGCDPDFKFNDIANLIERARVDFGVEIEFRDEYGLDGLMPRQKAKADDPQALMIEKHHLAKRGFAVADIKYTDANPGILLLIKTTLTPNLPADVYGYRNDNPKFPDQTTGDQFFNERQFEAYRELGYQLGKAMLETDEIKREWLVGAGASTPVQAP